MDIKAKVGEIVEKLKSDKDLQAKFTKDPAGCIKDLTGLDIPQEQLDSVISAVKAKMNLDSLSGIASSIGGLFGKK